MAPVTALVGAFTSVRSGHSTPGTERLGIFSEKFQKAIDIDPNSVEGYVNLGSTYDMPGEEEDAIASYRTAIKINPNHVEAFCSLGMLFARQGRVVEALDLLREGVQKCKDSPEIKHPMIL